MKLSNYLSTLILVIISNYSYSQNYQSLFGSNSTTWDIATIYCDAGCSKSLAVISDTVINSMNYKIISGNSDYLREDSLQGKAWIYNTNYNTEYLTMDLGLSLGDTFDIYDYTNSPFSSIVDSVYFSNNLKHIRLNYFISMCAPVEKITFIEGVGSTAGLFFQRNASGNNVFDYMLCQHKNGIKVASSLIFPDTCYIAPIGITEYSLHNKKLVVFPNPAYDEINIENSINTEFNFTIYNMLGSEMISGTESDAEFNIDISKLPIGVYLILVDSYNTLRSTKFLKQ